MRDLIYLLLPVAAVFYFLKYPEQFQALIAWGQSFFH